MVQSQRQLAVFLSKLRVFTKPQVATEQYPTDSEVAAVVLWDAFMHGDIEEKKITDLGAGTGILGIGALALGADHVTFVEQDPAAIAILRENIVLAQSLLKTIFLNFNVVQCDIADHVVSCDVVLQNPPFGTRQKHLDLVFLEKAVSIAPVVFSYHKTSTLEYLRRWVARHKLRITKEYACSFPLKQSMAMHTKRSQHVAVTCLKIES